MFVGALQFELLIAGAESIKDKRRVVRSVRDRLHQKHLVSVAEVGLLDRKDAALMGLAVVAGEEKRVHLVFDHALEMLSSLHDAELGEHVREVAPMDWSGKLACDNQPPLWTEDERRAWGEITLRGSDQ